MPKGFGNVDEMNENQPIELERNTIRGLHGTAHSDKLIDDVPQKGKVGNCWQPRTR